MSVRIVYKPKPFSDKLKGGLPEAMKEAALYMRSSTNKKINKGIAPENSSLTKTLKKGDKTLRDTNLMATSITPHSGELWASAGTKAKQAKILQSGGVIRPKKAKALWIPFSVKTKELMRKYGKEKPSGLIEAMKNDGYSFFFTSSAKVFMAQKGKGKPFALFLVRSSIKIPARPFLYFDEQDEKYIRSLIAKEIHKKLKEGKK